ncbi:MAG: glycosyltransferase family 4 protein [Aggregatilineales bacterium]
MRIGLISGEYPPMRGGVGDYTRELARALLTAGHAVFVLSDRRAKAETADIAVDNRIARWRWPSLWAARDWARRNRLDIVNLQYEAAAFGLGTPIHFLPIVIGVPTITTFHDLHVPYLFPKAGRLRRAALWWLARQSAGVIATTSADADRLRAEGRITKLATIPIGSNVSAAPPPDYNRQMWRARFDPPSDSFRGAPFVIGFFGFMNASKGIETLIDALVLLVQDKLDARLVLIGGGTTESDPATNAYTRQVKAQIDAAGLTERVLWSGFVSEAEVSAWLLACDAIALPFTDGVSLRRGSFMAALAHGCAIVTTLAAAPIPELNGAALYVPIGSVVDFATALRTLSDDPARRIALGMQAKALAAQFSWESIATRTAAFYETVICGLGVGFMSK